MGLVYVIRPCNWISIASVGQVALVDDVNSVSFLSFFFIIMPIQRGCSMPMSSSGALQGENNSEMNTVT